MIIKNSQSNFKPAPEGRHDAVCVDVVDLGMVETQWGEQHKVRLVFQIDSKMQNGKPYIVSKNYRASLHKQANLRKDLRTWRGKDFTEQESKEFDLEKLIGVPCTLFVDHSETETGIYANITTIIKAGDKKMVATDDYIRVKDRDGYKVPQKEVSEEQINKEFSMAASESDEVDPF